MPIARPCQWHEGACTKYTLVLIGPIDQALLIGEKHIGHRLSRARECRENDGRRSSAKSLGVLSPIVRLGGLAPSTQPSLSIRFSHLTGVRHLFAHTRCTVYSDEANSATTGEGEANSANPGT